MLFRSLKERYLAISDGEEEGDDHHEVEQHNPLIETVTSTITSTEAHPEVEATQVTQVKPSIQEEQPVLAETPVPTEASEVGTTSSSELAEAVAICNSLVFGPESDPSFSESEDEDEQQGVVQSDCYNLIEWGLTTERAQLPSIGRIIDQHVAPPRSYLMV